VDLPGGMTVAGAISPSTLLAPAGSAPVHLDERQFILKTDLYSSDAMKNLPIQKMTLGSATSGKIGSRCVCESYPKVHKAWH
jgi:hypothetical protein